MVNRFLATLTLGLLIMSIVLGLSMPIIIVLAFLLGSISTRLFFNNLIEQGKYYIRHYLIDNKNKGGSPLP